jgi:4-amino-4-deoxy-L-arabinose transferase-like glycosyltransferase
MGITSSYWVLWAAIFILYTVIRLNMVNIPLDRDEGIFGYIGQVILDGGLPYRDVFDHKPPVVYYLNALALLFVPPTTAGIHVFLHIYNFLTLIALYFFVTIYTQSHPTAFWVAFVYAVFSSIPTIQGFTASTEMFMLLPLTMSLLFAALTIRKGKLYLSMLSGLCSALAFFTKQTAAPIIFFIFVYLLLAHINLTSKRRINHKLIIKLALTWCAGFGIVSLLIAAYFYYHGILDEFFYLSFTYSYIYSKKVSIFDILPRIYQIIVEIFVANLVFLSVGLLASLVAMFRKDSKGIFSLGFLLFSFLATVPGFAYRHYFAQVAPAVAIAGGFGFAILIDAILAKKLKIATAVVCVAATIATPVLIHSDYYITKTPNELSRDFFGFNPFPESVVLAKFIKERTGKEDSIFIVGSEAQIFLLSQRNSATSFAYIYPLVSSHPRYKEFQRKAWDEISSKPPLYIITIDLRASRLWDGRADLWILRKTKKMVLERYYLEAVMTIKKPNGDLFVDSEIKNFQDIVKKHVCPIYVFRRKL